MAFNAHAAMLLGIIVLAMLIAAFWPKKKDK
jgi:hypothetical protein